MPSYRRVGNLPEKRHLAHLATSPASPASPPARLSEELMGEEGFSGASSLLYHRRSPSAILRAEPAEVCREQAVANASLAPLHLRLARISDPVADAGGGEGESTADPVLGRRVLLANADVQICWVVASTSSGLYRNAAGDEIVFVASGTAVLESVFGSLAVRAGDYVVVPASTTHRWVVEGPEAVSLLVLEASGHVGIPARYMTATGQMKEGAPFSERDLRAPEATLEIEGDEVEVLIRHRGGWARHLHKSHPFDVVGWDGCVYPYAFSIHDFEPIVGRVHQPPPVHQTFAGPGFVVCSFVPRLLDFDPRSVKVPYHHANVDSDEVLFYVDGEFTSRAGAGIERGSMTLHPAGFVHGPQPGSVEAAAQATRTDETAVMVDTFRPLRLTPTSLSVSDPSYLTSWTRQPA